jgi:phosphoglycolate phosphatase
MRRALPKDISEEVFKNCYACFKDHYSKHCCEKTRPYDGILDTLKILKSRGVKIGIVSNKFQEAAEDVCEHYFEGLYDAVMGESETCRRKPAPDGINMICEQFEVEKDEAIFFGDSEVDIQTADNAGVYSVSVLWGFRDREFLTCHGAHLFIENPLDIADMID